MPTVAAEAMMHGVPCLLSDGTGTAAYIHDGKNGLVFQSENALGLAEKIRWCIVHNDSLHSMGAEARKVFEERFASDVFEKELMQLVDFCMDKRRITETGPI